jgi:hypothetical protein
MSVRPFALALALALALRCLVGPSAAGGAPAPPAPPPPPSPSSVAGSVGPAAGPRVELLDAGAEPRRVLRVAPAAGTRQTVELRQTAIFRVTRGALELPPAAPVLLALRLVAEVRAVTPRGAVHYALRLSDVHAEAAPPETPPAVLRALRQLVPGLRGARAEVVVDPRGVVRHVVSRPPPGSAPALRRAYADLEAALRSLSTPFPVEPVGVGARWRVHSALVAAGVGARQEALYDLVAVDGERVTTRYALTQALVPGAERLTSDELPRGVEARVSALAGRGEGERTDRMDRPLPVAGRAWLETDVSLELRQADETEPLRTHTRTEWLMHTGGEAGPAEASGP